MIVEFPGSAHRGVVELLEDSQSRAFLDMVREHWQMLADRLGIPNNSELFYRFKVEGNHGVQLDELAVEMPTALSSIKKAAVELESQIGSGLSDLDKLGTNVTLNFEGIGDIRPSLLAELKEGGYKMVFVLNRDVPISGIDDLLKYVDGNRADVLSAIKGGNVPTTKLKGANAQHYFGKSDVEVAIKEIEVYTVDGNGNLVGNEIKVLSDEVADIPSLVAKWDNITVIEAKSIYSKLSKTDALGSKTVVSQTEILAEINSSSSLVNPYNFAYSIDNIVLSQEALFVRVHNSWNPNRPWLVAVEDFQKFTSQDDMIKKLALPILDNSGNIVKPTQISIVKVPAGTKVRKSVARPQDWPGQGHQSGGSIQFEIRDNPAIPRSWFKPMGSVSDYLN